MTSADKVLEKYILLLKEFIEKNTLFMNLPSSILSLNSLSDKILSDIVNELSYSVKSLLPNYLPTDKYKLFSNYLNPSDDEIKRYVNSDKLLRSILSSIESDYTGDFNSYVLTECLKDEPPYNLLSKSSTISLSKGEDYLSMAEEITDFDDKISFFNRTTYAIDYILKDVESIFPLLLISYIFAIRTKDWLSRNTTPSLFRGIYLSRSIRMISSAIKYSKSRIRDRSKEMISTEGLTSSLKKIDTVIIAIGIAYGIYRKNKDILQKKSFSSFSDTIQSITCTVEPPESPTDRPLELSPIDISAYPFSCPISLDDFIVPKYPIEDKIDDFSCPIDIHSIYSPNIESSPAKYTLPLKALYADLRTTLDRKNYPLNILVSPGSRVSYGNAILTFGEKTVLSSVSGTVTRVSIEKGEIEIDINSEDSSLGEYSNVNDIALLYRELSQVEDAIDSLSIQCLLPILLLNSHLLDSSISKSSIVYKKGGLEERVKEAQDSRKTIRDSYIKEVKNITKETRIKSLAERSEDMKVIKEDIDSAKKRYFSNLERVYYLAIEKGKKTEVDKKYLELTDWYISLYYQLLSIRDSSKSLSYMVNTPIEDQISAGVVSKVIISLQAIVEEIISNRIRLFKGEEIAKSKIEELALYLDEGASLNKKYKKYYDYLYSEYKKSLFTGVGESQGTVSLTPALNSALKAIEALGKKNKKLTTEEKELVRFRIYTIFSLIQRVEEKSTTVSTEVITLKDLTRRECSALQDFFTNLWKKYKEIPLRIDEILSKLGDSSRIYLPELSLKRDSDVLKYYPISTNVECPKADIPDDISPFTTKDLKSLDYWVRYLSIATLSSVLSPPWSIGIPPPINLPLPTVYIPIKPFVTEWGIILIGLTVTGLWVFPFILVVNQDILYHVPFVDPATAIKREIKALGEEIKKIEETFREKTLKEYLDREVEKIDKLNRSIEGLEAEKRELRKNRPKRVRSIDDNSKGMEFKEKISSVEERAKNEYENLDRYEKEVEEWAASLEDISSKILLLKRERYKEEVKANILSKAIRGDRIKNASEDLKPLESSQDRIDSLEDKLNSAVDKMNDILAAYPGSASPEKSYFFPTLKNPKPLQEIGTGVPEINSPLLQALQKAFDISKEALSDISFPDKLNDTFLNSRKVYGDISLKRQLIIPVDPFPKYESLNLTNTSWTIGYLPNWGNIGNAQFGMPGFPRLPETT